jgi:hypothetical protein
LRLLDKHIQCVQQRLLAAGGARPQAARVAMLQGTNATVEAISDVGEAHTVVEHLKSKWAHM